MSLLTSPAYQIAEKIFTEKGKFNIQEAFIDAVAFDEVMRVAKQRAEVEAMKHVPDVIQTLAKLVRQKGDVKAAKALLEIVGLTGGGKGSHTTVATQININPQELLTLESDLYVDDNFNR